MENNQVDYLVSYLVSTFRTGSAFGFAMVKVGQYVEVRVDTAFGDSTPRVELNWPGIGAQGPAVAAQFAADLAKAATVAALVIAQLGAK